MSTELTKSKFVRRPSGGLWHQLSLNLSHGYLSSFICWLSWGIRPGGFLIFQQKIYFWDLLRIFCVFVNIGSYGSKTFQNANPPTNRTRKFSNFSWNFSIVLTKVPFFDFWNFYITILTSVLHFLYHGTLWEQNLQNATPSSNHYRILPEFYSQLAEFWNFEFLSFNQFLFTIVPYGERKKEKERP